LDFLLEDERAMTGKVEIVRQLGEQA